MSFEPIPAFNKKLDFKDAFSWKRDDILGFLEKVAHNPSDYKVPASHQENLKKLYKHIYDLKSPDGVRFVTPKRPQQILRTGPKPPKLDPTNPIPWEASAPRKPYFIIFDLLGVFLSLIGPAPDGANDKNYFLPLVVVYAKWCSALAKSISSEPSVVQVTWASGGAGKHSYAFLGASAAGYDDGNPWGPLVKKERHSYLLDILPVQYHDYTKSPAVGDNGQSGTLLGNCAETYPFIYILGDKDLKKNASGISLCVSGTASHSKNDGHDYWKDASLWPPCDNCQELLNWYDAKARLPDFKPWEHDSVVPLEETDDSES